MSSVVGSTLSEGRRGRADNIRREENFAAITAFVPFARVAKLEEKLLDCLEQVMQPTSMDTRRGLAFRVDEIVVDSIDPAHLARFWAELLSFVVVDNDDAMYLIEDPAGGGPSICFQKVPERKLVKNRLHLDLQVPEGMFEKAVATVLLLGGTVVDVGQPQTSSWAVFADPEGNEFCLIE